MFDKKEGVVMVKIDTIFFLMKKKGVSPKMLSDQTGISPGNISDWKSGKSFPKAEALLKIADYFGVSVDYLLGRKESNSVSAEVTNNNGVIGHINAPTTIKSTSLDNTSLSTQEIDLLRIYRQSDGKTQMKIMQFVYDLDNK